MQSPAAKSRSLMPFRYSRKGLETYTVEIYLKVRHDHFQETLSGRAIARDFGIRRHSEARLLTYSEPPEYRRRP